MSGQEQPPQAAGQITSASSFYDHLPSAEHVAVMRYLNMPDLHLIPERDMANLNEVVQWAQEASKANDRLSILSAIRWLESRLGSPRVGESRVAHLYSWIRLDQEERKINQEKKLYEK